METKKETPPEVGQEQESHTDPLAIAANAAAVAVRAMDKAGALAKAVAALVEGLRGSLDSRVGEHTHASRLRAGLDEAERLLAEFAADGEDQA